MPRRPHGPPSSAATTLAPLPPRSGSTTDAERRAHGAHARVTRLREAIRRTRVELATRERRDGWIARRFDTDIRPRERAFTAAVCRTTARLVTHHERTDLGPAERSLLGLWITDNLQSLAVHPFAPREATDALARRWQRHLGAARHPLDASLASLCAARRGDTFAGTGGDAPASRVPGGGDGAPDGPVRGGGRDGGYRRREPRHARDTADPDPARHDPGRIVSRLFRRLARVLHPDREPDETGRQIKHRLMSDCLRARDERDVDTLLSLHLQHVGALPDDLTDDDPVELAGLLRRQLDALRERLRRREAGGGLAAQIVARYAAADTRESERRFEVHAGALDGEIERFEDLERRIDDPAGLREALAARRAIELDRLAIDELTGASE